MNLFFSLFLSLASVSTVIRGIPETSDCYFAQGPCLAFVLLFHQELMRDE